jgi:protein phosphatase
LLPERNSTTSGTPRAGSASAPALQVAGVTDVGRVRRRNEDAIDWDVQLGLVMVADGMGGSQGGDIASRTALQSIKEDLRRALAESERNGGRALTREVRASLVVELVRRANQGVRKSASRDNRLLGMGTTLVMALVGPDFLTSAHVGDSRMYRLREGAIARLTDDHSMVQELVHRGQMDERQAAQSRHRNVITRALGIAQDVLVDVEHHAMQAGDIFMLCSDGLTNMVADADIAAAIAQFPDDLQAAANNAVQLANARGGRDNVSVVLLRILATSNEKA